MEENQNQIQLCKKHNITVGSNSFAMSIINLLHLNNFHVDI